MEDTQLIHVSTHQAPSLGRNKALLDEFPTFQDEVYVKIAPYSHSPCVSVPLHGNEKKISSPNFCSIFGHCTANS